MPPLAAGDVDDLLATTLNGFPQLPAGGPRRPGPVGPGAGRRAQLLRDGHRRDDGRNGEGRRPDQRPGRAAVARRRAGPRLPVLLRAAAAPRARLRRPEGHPGDPGRGGTADADGDLASACGARRGPRRTICRGSRTWTWSRRARSATASRTRCSACGCGCTAARCRRPPRKWRARCSSTRSRGCRKRSRGRPRTWPTTPVLAYAGADGRRAQELRHHRDRLTRARHAARDWRAPRRRLASA